MDTRRLRVRIGGWGAVAVGLLGSVVSLALLGTDGALFVALFGVFGVGGALLLGGRTRFYYYLLPVVGVLALVLAVGHYLRYGFASLTVALLLITVAATVKSLQAYRAYS